MLTERVEKANITLDYNGNKGFEYVAIVKEIYNPKTIIKGFDNILNYIKDRKFIISNLQFGERAQINKKQREYLQNVVKEHNEYLIKNPPKVDPAIAKIY